MRCREGWCCCQSEVWEGTTEASRKGVVGERERRADGGGEGRKEGGMPLRLSVPFAELLLLLLLLVVVHVFFSFPRSSSSSSSLGGEGAEEGKSAEVA
jgi:hypothetical protein